MVVTTHFDPSPACRGRPCLVTCLGTSVVLTAAAVVCMCVCACLGLPDPPTCVSWGTVQTTALQQQRQIGVCAHAALSRTQIPTLAANHRQTFACLGVLSCAFSRVPLSVGVPFLGGCSSNQQPLLLCHTKHCVVLSGQDESWGYCSLIWVVLVLAQHT